MGPAAERHHAAGIAACCKEGKLTLPDAKLLGDAPDQTVNLRGGAPQQTGTQRIDGVAADYMGGRRVERDLGELCRVAGKRCRRGTDAGEDHTSAKRPILIKDRKRSSSVQRGDHCRPLRPAACTGSEGDQIGPQLRRRIDPEKYPRAKPGARRSPGEPA